MSDDQRSPLLLAALVAAALLVAGVFGFAFEADRVRTEEKLMFAERGGRVAARFINEVDRVLVDLGAAALAGGASPERGAQAFRALAADTIDARVVFDVESVAAAEGTAGEGSLDERGSPTPSPAIDLTDAGVIATLAAARDTGEVRVTPPLGDGHVLAVAALSGGETSSTAERRAGLAGHVLVAIDPAAVTSMALGEFALTDVKRVVLVDAGVDVLDPTAAVPADLGDAVERTLSVGGREWRLGLLRGDPPGSPGSAWVVFAVAAALSAVVLGGAALVRRNQRRSATSIESRERELILLSELGPVLQRGLELADILPAAVVRMADSFGADRAGVAVADDAGYLREVFSIGASSTRFPDHVSDLPPPSRGLVPTDEVVIPLHRADRIIGALRLRSRSELTESRFRSLRAGCDLLAAAVGNAIVFQRELETVRRLREVDELKTTFLATASHELRTPITAIAGFSDILINRWDDLTDEQRTDFMGRIGRNARSLAALVQQLLDFSDVERGTTDVTVEPVDLADAVTALVQQLSVLGDDRDVRIDADAPVVVAADRRGLDRVITNLLTNAVKYSPAGSPIVVTVSRVDDGGVVEVDDAGSGVAAEERDKVFSRFYRSDRPEVVQTRGAGIGLAVVRELTEMMGGTVTIADSPLGGARFSIHLPLAERTAPVAGRAP